MSRLPVLQPWSFEMIWSAAFENLHRAACGRVQRQSKNGRAPAFLANAAESRQRQLEDRLTTERAERDVTDYICFR
jgi:hypothetical protein